MALLAVTFAEYSTSVRRPGSVVDVWPCTSKRATAFDWEFVSHTVYDTTSHSTLAEALLVVPPGGSHDMNNVSLPQPRHTRHSVLTAHIVHSLHTSPVLVIVLC